MAHTHTPKTTRIILSNNLYECACGARKWSNGREITTESGTMRVEDGWYIYVPAESPKDARRRHDIEMLQTEGYGYDYNQPSVRDQYDGGRGAGSLGQPID